jgi:hypothetical protein
VSLVMSHIGYGLYAGADAASQRRLNVALRACLRYIHSLRRLDYVSHFKTSVMGALRRLILGFSFYRFFTKCSMSVLFIY